ncbi:MAG: PD-(D/E)XK nuclease family protein [Chloroflexota bacterium]|nr:PD-(D/E)XK nuclease family protein [Chloroflexota bacterium]MDQ5864452.1 PD-(D/E)XK nuclease family protein [Chloroflexota bacterium]
MFAESRNENSPKRNWDSDAVLKLSPSSVEVAQACLLRLAHEYSQPRGVLDRIDLPSIEEPKRQKREVSYHVSFGYSLHDALAEIFHPRNSPHFAPWKEAAGAPAVDTAGGEVVETQTQATLDDYLSAVLERHWHSDGFACREEELASKKVGRGLLKYAYAALLPQPTTMILGVESVLVCKTRIGGLLVELTCRVDCLLLHVDGTLEVLDYKTSKNGEVPSPGVLASDLSAYLYFRIAWECYRNHPLVRNVVVSHVNLHSLKKTTAHFDQAQIVTNRQRMRELVRHIVTGPPLPTPNRNCCWCVIQRSCPVWLESNSDDLLEHFDEWRNRQSPPLLEDRGTAEGNDEAGEGGASDGAEA